MNNCIAGLQSVLNNLARPGYRISTSLDPISDTIFIRVYNINSNSYRIHSFNNSIFVYQPTSDVIDDIINQLVLNDHCLEGFQPRYRDNFDLLMHQILYDNYIPGKLY